MTLNYENMIKKTAMIIAQMNGQPFSNEKLRLYVQYLDHEIHSVATVVAARWHLKCVRLDGARWKGLYVSDPAIPCKSCKLELANCPIRALRPPQTRTS